MIKIIMLFVVPCIFLAIGAYWLYFSGWKRGMVQGERVTKAFLSKKIKKILKNEAKIKADLANLEKVYLAFDKKIKALEIKKGIKVEEVKDARDDFGNLRTVHPRTSADLLGMDQCMAQGLVGSQISGQQSPLHSLFGGFFAWLKPPWM